MPLTEISANVRRNGSQSHKSTQAPSQAKSPRKVNQDVVSSMLRTTTEIGDIGQFSVKPSRLPRSASRLPTRSRSGSLSAPATSLRPSTRRPLPKYDSHRLPRPVPSLSALSRQDTVRSNLTSYHSNPRTRGRTASRAPYGFDRRASPASGSGLYSHPSFLTLRGGPGHRPASPAFSDAQSMPGYNRHPGFHQAASVATAASSPASMLNRDHPYTYWELNRSASSLSRLPSPAMPGAYPGMRRSPYPSRHATPVSMPLHHSARLASLESCHTMQRSATGSTTPQYYDYTEAFAEEYCQVPPPDTSISPLFSADHTIPEQEPLRLTRQAQTPFGMVDGSIFKPCEMPTQHNRTHSEQSGKSRCDDTVIQKSQHKENVEIAEDNSRKPKVSCRSAAQYGYQ